MTEMRSTDKQAILVAGYYRSGTSALCGSLTDLGVQILSDAQSNEANPKGFFESTELIKFDIRVLEMMNAYWSDLSDLPGGWIERADVQLQRDVLAEMLERQFAGAPLVAVKHPHLCRLLPLYVQAVRDIGYTPKVLHTHRAPYAVATSQATKNNMTRAHAVALWASYITTAEAAARGLPRAWVHYPDLLRDADATVRRALSGIGIEVSGERSVEFISKALNRSAAADGAGLFAPLAALVDEVEAAILDGAGPEVWDDLRARSADLAGFVDELGRSGNRAAPGVGQGVLVATGGARALQLGGATQAHPVRPAERGDAAARTRVMDLLGRARARAEAAGGTLPGVSVLIACPEGATQAQLKATLDSLAQNWLQPEVKVAHATAPRFGLSGMGLTLEQRHETDAEMTAALFAAMGAAKTDYAAIVNAGDLIEPDAIARMTLAVAASGADMIYCDEVAPGPGGPWIRAKPAMAPTRLVESCFVGDWVWYRSATVAALGGFRPDLYPGAEEQDLQVRLVGAGHLAESLPEALFVRGEGTRRDSVPLDTATESARASIAAYLERAGVAASVRKGALPGLFALDYAGRPDPAVTLGIDCRPGVTPDLAQAMVNRLLPRHDGRASRIVFLRHDGADPAMARFLDQVAAEVTPGHPSISVRDAGAALGETLAGLAALAPDNHVALVDPVSAPSADDILAHLAAQLDGQEGAGVIAPLTFYRDGERMARLQGPLLFGAPARIGAGYEAGAPGPGGWLATTQPVDAVDGPMVMLRRGVATAPGFASGAGSWAEVCAGLDPARLSAYWTPHHQVEIPDPGAAESPELAAARAIPYRGRHHHPAMTLSGSPLMLEGRAGLVDTEAALLVTSSNLADDAQMINAARAARQSAGLSAGIVPEPIDALSVLRARGQGRRWLRLNPRTEVLHPGTGAPIPSDATFWSTLPADDARALVTAAGRTIVSSPALAARLRGMGARHVSVAPPRLSRDIWAGFQPTPAKTKPALIWVEETGVPVPWIGQAITETADLVAWTVVAQAPQELPGTVARKPMPVFEEDWARLFAETGATILIRPTPGAGWCDDYLVRVGLAGGCRVVAGREAEIDPAVEALVTRRLSSDAVARWVGAIRALAEEASEDTLRTAFSELPGIWRPAPGEGLESGLAALAPELAKAAENAA